MLFCQLRKVSYFEAQISDELNGFQKAFLHLLSFIRYKENSGGRLINLGFSVRYMKNYLDQTAFLKFENTI